jgi:adenosine deaminase
MAEPATPMTPLGSLSKKLPKAELHLHIEGTLEPEMLMALAKRNNVEVPFKDAEECRRAYSFTNLQSFLDIYYKGASVLLHEQDFFDLTMAYFEKAHEDAVRHAEIFFDPQTHLDRNVPMKTVVDGLVRACKEAEARWGITSHLIMCFLRHCTEAECFAAWEQAKPFAHLFKGIGLDSSEVGHPPEKFERLFAECRAAGLRAVAHAGEEGPCEHVWGALDTLKVHRIDHGVRSIEDDALMNRLIKERIPLTVCPLSNVALKVYERVEDMHCLEKLRRGVVVTINSDDPAYFGGYIGDNYACLEKLGATPAELAQLAKHSFEASWIDESRKEALYREIDEVLAHHHAKHS